MSPLQGRRLATLSALVAGGLAVRALYAADGLGPLEALVFSALVPGLFVSDEGRLGVRDLALGSGLLLMVTALGLAPSVPVMLCLVPWTLGAVPALGGGPRSGLVVAGVALTAWGAWPRAALEPGPADGPGAPGDHEPGPVGSASVGAPQIGDAEVPNVPGPIRVRRAGEAGSSRYLPELAWHTFDGRTWSDPEPWSADDVAPEPTCQLPTLDPRVEALASELRGVVAVVAAVQARVRYDDTAPAAEGDPLADLLFGTRRGVCEHFATATAVLLRASGRHRTRVVTGLAFGEDDGPDRVYRAGHAHAWVEAWTPAGWRIVESTPPRPPTVEPLAVASQAADPAPAALQPSGGGALALVAVGLLLVGVAGWPPLTQRERAAPPSVAPWPRLVARLGLSRADAPTDLALAELLAARVPAASDDVRALARLHVAASFGGHPEQRSRQAQLASRVEKAARG